VPVALFGQEFNVLRLLGDLGVTRASFAARAFDFQRKVFLVLLGVCYGGSRGWAVMVRPHGVRTTRRRPANLHRLWPVASPGILPTGQRKLALAEARVLQVESKLRLSAG
jgi:hypothetical protein